MFLSQKLIELIERNADELARRWLSDVQTHVGTPTYHSYDEKELYRRAFDVYSRLGDWLSQKTTREEIAKVYTDMGKERRKEGFSLSEVIQALITTRRHIWLKVLEEGLLDTALQMYQAIDLINRVVLFFDRAIYFTAVGYESND